MSLLFALLLGVSRARAEIPLPPGLADVGVTPHLGVALDPSIQFRDAEGGAVRLGDVLDGKRPVVLALAWYRCKMVCGVLLRGLAEAAARAPVPPGAAWQLLSVSYDDADTAEDARAARARTLAYLGGDAPWAFWTGSAPAIQALTQGLGVRVARSREGDILHPVVVFVLSPDGRVRELLDGPAFDPAVLGAALARAALPPTALTMPPPPLVCARPMTIPPVVALWTRMAAGAVIVGLLAVVSASELRAWQRP
jgi:protein SCO1/2